MSVDKFGRFDRSNKNLSGGLQDGASLDFVKNNFLSLSKENNHYNAKDIIIRNVPLPLQLNDVVNLQYVQNYALGRSADMHYTAKSKRIRDLRDPVLPTDAANMEYVGKRSLKRTYPDDHIDLEGKLVRNLGEAVLPTDAVNMEYHSKHTPTMYDTYWMFGDKRLSNVQDPSYDGEAVNLRTLKSMSLVKEIGANKHYDAKGFKIENIARCENDGDAVNLKLLRKYIAKWITHHESQLERLSAAIFDYIHRSSGQSAQAGVTNKNYLNWDEILSRKLFEEEDQTEDDSNIRSKRV